MTVPPTYEELAHRVKELENEVAKCRRADTALRESEERYRDLVETVNDVIWEVDLKGRYTYISPRVRDVLGYHPQEILGEPFFEKMSPDEYNRVSELFNELVETPKVFTSLETTPLHKDGHEVILENSGKPFFTSDGALMGYRGVNRDITHKKQVEEALRNSEKRLNLVLDATQDGVWDWDIVHKKIYTSARFKELIGFKGDDSMIEIEDWAPHIHPDHRERVMETMHAHLNKERPYDIDYLYRRGHDEAYRWHHVRGMTIFDETGKAFRMVGSIRDITKGKQVEAELHRSEERLRLAYEATNDGIWDLIIPENKIFFSPRLKNLLGYQENEQIPDSWDYWTSRIHPDQYERIMNQVKAYMEERSSFNFDFLFLFKNEEYRWLNCRCMLVHDEKGNPYRFIGSARDIHSEKQAEELIRKLTHSLINSQETERQMISRELHDGVAQDLSASRINCETILKYRSLTPGIRKKVSELSDSLRRTLMTVRDLSYDLRPPGLHDLGLTRTLFQFCREVSDKTGVKIGFYSAGIDELDLDYETKINLFRLVQEGLNNVKKHAAANNATIRLVSSFPNIILRIEDDGKGFDLKERVATASKEKRMGLRSMEERVVLLKGRMEIQSGPNKGTKIKIEIPYMKNPN